MPATKSPTLCSSALKNALPLLAHIKFPHFITSLWGFSTLEKIRTLNINYFYIIAKEFYGLKYFNNGIHMGFGESIKIYISLLRNMSLWGFSTQRKIKN